MHATIALVLAAQDLGFSPYFRPQPGPHRQFDSPAQAAHISPTLAFSAGFTDDAVLQRYPAAAAVYGVSPSDSAVSVTVTDDTNGASYTVAADPTVLMGGTADPLCQARCLEAGHCEEGQISSCQKPSCAMGCILAGRTSSPSACKSACADAASDKAGCEFVVVSPAGPWHLPDDTTQNETLQMCFSGPVLSNGTQCGACGGPGECEPGCDFGAPAGRASLVAWKALLRPTKAGGSYTVEATDGTSSAALRRVTFGDVYFCSGQSNMDLSLEYTFAKPQLDEDVAQGAYDNIRLFMYGDMGTKYEELVPTYATTTGTLGDVTGAGGTWGNLSAASRANPKGTNMFSQFSATCFYFGKGLTDIWRQHGAGVVPLGLVQSAIGGSQIEAWTPDSALRCKNESYNADGQAPPGRLWNGMGAPFVNMSVRGHIWYQGENNCGGDIGSSADGTGYGCQLPTMIAEWRKLWSATPGTTAPTAPFGVVSLAAGGSEGHDEAMAHMRWSQTGNYGVLPSPPMPGAFLAHGYDLGDPMDNLRPPCINATDQRTNASAFGPGGPCVWPAASAWNAAVRDLRPAVFANAAPSFMGGIHPRFKREVGRRLAAALWGSKAPTLGGCSVRDGAVELRFAPLGGDRLTLQWGDAEYNMSGWAVADSSSLMVCVGNEQRTSAPSDCLADASLWAAAPLRLPAAQGTQAAADAPTLVVDVSALRLGPAGPLAVRYGWPLSRGADTCCPFEAVASGMQPCVPGSCPILTADSSLPANPFYATLDAGRCRCLAPQTCDD